MSTSNPTDQTDSVFIYHRKNVCCCGRYVLSNGEPLIQNNIIHQELGPEENFCGSYDHYTIFQFQKQTEAFISKFKEIKEQIETDFMLNGEWVNNPSNLIKSLHKDCVDMIESYK